MTRPARPQAVPLSVLVAIVRNPLEALPPAVFHAPMVHMRAAGRDRLYLCDPALIHEALVRNADAMIKGDETRRTLGPALREGLLTADGAQWRWQRRSVAAGFQPQRVAAFAPVMVAAARRTRDRWLALEPGTTLRLGHEMMHTAFDIIVETMLSGARGLDVGRFERAIADYLAPTGWALAYSLMRAPDWTPYPGRGRARRAAAYLRASLAAQAAQRRASGGDGGRDDLLDRLLAARDPEGGRAMTDEEVVDNLLTFVAAGHETTALGLAWTFHLLARHPEVDARVIEEIAAVTGGAPVGPEHLDGLVYTGQVFAEAMRLYPPVPIISRETTRDFTLAGRPVPAGTVLVVPIYAVHRQSQLWPEPERFDPDRFAPAAVEGRPRLAYLPFGAGPRVCIGSGFAGIEATAVLAVLLQRLRLTGAGRAAPRPVMRITLRPRPEIRMRVEAR